MKVLGLDLSTDSGIAVVETGKKVLHTEQVHFKKLKGWDRAAAIAGRILQVHADHKPNLVVIEGYGYSNAYTLATLVEIGTIVRYFLWQEGIHYKDVPPSSLKMFVLGKGVGKKEMMMMEIFKKWGFTAPTNDQADAVGLGMFGLAILGEKFDATAMKAVDAVVNPKPAKPRKKQGV